MGTVGGRIAGAKIPACLSFLPIDNAVWALGNSIHTIGEVEEIG